MKWKTTLLFFFIVLFCPGYHAGLAQVPTPLAMGAVSAGTGSVSGRVLVQGKPVPRVHLALQRATPSSMAVSSAVRSESDAEGHYKFSGLSAGSYTISPLNSVYIWGEGRPGEAAHTITLGDGEQATEVDVLLKRGGVVTGKVVDANGNPVVAQFVQVDRADGPRGLPAIGVLPSIDFTTDDRGVYRYYGVPPGKYRVSCGDGEGSFRRSTSGKIYPRTFHPDVTEESLATIIEVGAGNETTGVDIRLSPAMKTYSIAGRAVDADTNQPVGGLSITLDMPSPDGRSRQFGGQSSAGSSGDFVLNSVRAGRWRISADSGYAIQGSGATGYSDPIFVDVRDENVTGVEIRVKRGGSITGVVVIEGETNIPNAPRLIDQQLMVIVRPKAAEVLSSPLRPLQLAADGSFRADGLRAGRAQVAQVSPQGTIGLKLVRTERDGQVVPDGIEVGAGENVTGVRLVFAYASANIIGQVVITGGALPSGVTLAVIARTVGGGMWSGSARADARGNFVIERLVPGQYEVEARPISQQNPQQAVSGSGVKQTINLAHGETAKVTLTFALKAP